MRMFCTELPIRTDDIDMNNHVHTSKYLDYVLTARFDQMGRCYGMSMNDFASHGYTWYTTKNYIEFKRPLLLGDTALVHTGLESMFDKGCKVAFRIESKQSAKVCAEGWFEFMMLNLSTKRTESIPEFVINHYAPFM